MHRKPLKVYFLNLLLFLIPTHAQQLVIIQWMDSCIPKEEEEVRVPYNLQNGGVHPVL
jgi:hypothetical protein